MYRIVGCILVVAAGAGMGFSGSMRLATGRVIMDYKKEIIEMIDKINDDSLLEFFYRFIARVLKNRGN